MKKRKTHNHLIFLVIGGLIGLVLAGYGIFEKISDFNFQNQDAIALVNDVPIKNESYLRALDRYSSDSKNKMDDEDRAWVLQRLIEEELLVQRGFSLGMITSDNDVRGAIVRTLISSINTEAEAIVPEKEELINFYNNNKERFAYPATYSIEAWVSKTMIDTQIAIKQLNNNDSIEINKNIKRLENIPNGLLTLKKITEYLGPSIASKIKPLSEGVAFSHHENDRWYIIQINQKNEESFAPIENIQIQLKNEFIRDQADKRLRAYIDNLKENASINYLNER